MKPFDPFDGWRVARYVHVGENGCRRLPAWFGWICTHLPNFMCRLIPWLDGVATSYKR